MITADRIAEVRKRLGESQADFGTRFGVHQSTIDRWESEGVPNRQLLQDAVKMTLEKIEFPEGVQ